MNIHVRRRRDTFIAMKGFRMEYPDDFPAGSDEAEQMDEIEAVLALIEEYGGDQATGSGNVRYTYHSKGIARENLRELMNDISIIAGTLAYRIPGIDLIFHIPKNLPDAALLALARSFADQAPAYKGDFARRGLDPSFVTVLQAAAASFESSLPPPEMATGTQVEATAQLGEAVRRGMIARNILKGMLKIKYKNSPAKMRAWLSASHIERDNRGEDAKDATQPAG
jgi:hypothetical protein